MSDLDVPCPVGPAQTVVAAMAGLPGATPGRLAALLDHDEPLAVWDRLRRGWSGSSAVPSQLVSRWSAHAAEVDLVALQRRLVGLGATVTWSRSAGHPARLHGDPDPVPVLFRRGRLPGAARPHVAVIGTRRATSPGREIARELGVGLARAGVVVVSGLALGIDGAAHRGALLGGGAPPLAIVGSGLDVAYPAAHADLWDEIARVGAVLTEAPLGAAPEPWRFPARNRLIAGFADLVVVVESRQAGGSLLTVEQAIRRGVEVMAVPGSVRNPAAEGTNQLLADGCAPVRDVADVLVALDLGVCSRDGAPVEGALSDVAVPPDLAVVYEAVDDGPTSVDVIVARTGLEVLDVHARVAALVACHLVVDDGGRVRRR